MAGYPPPPPPPYGPADWRAQQRGLRDQAKAMRYQARAQRDAYRAQYRSLRRSSIAGPILLIAIGTIVLLEWIVDQLFHDNDHPYVRRSIGGGVVTLLLLLAFAGIAFN